MPNKDLKFPIIYIYTILQKFGAQPSCSGAPTNRFDLKPPWALAF